MKRINLLRPRLPSREIREAQILTGLALVLTLLLILSLIACGIGRGAVRAAGGELLAAEAQLSAVSGDVERWQALMKETRRLEGRLEALGAALPGERRFTPLLEEIAEALGEGCTAERIAISPQEGLSLRGRAQSYRAAADCVERLRALPALSAVVLQSAYLSESADQVDFQVVGELWPGEGGGGE